jgi:hypothetical protein
VRTILHALCTSLRLFAFSCQLTMRWPLFFVVFFPRWHRSQMTQQCGRACQGCQSPHHASASLHTRPRTM